MRYVEQALDQIDWEFSRTSFNENKRLTEIQSKLRDIRDKEENSLTLADVTRIIKATDNSIRKVGAHDYGASLEGQSEGLRQFAMQPLFDLRTELLEMQEALKNES